MKNRIGLIGCGLWGKNILRDLLALNAEVLVVATSEKSRDEAVQQGASGAYSDLKDIANRVAGFVVATPTSTHADVLDQLLIYNKPIFVEKPLTDDVYRARRLLRYGKGKIFVMDKWRYHPGIDMLSQKVKRGELGQILLIRTCRLNWGNPHNDVDAMWILLPHDLSIVLHILGRLPPLYSTVPLVSLDPSAGAVVTLKDNKTPAVIIEISTVLPQKQRSIYVVGSKGTMLLTDGYDDKLIFVKGRPAELDYSLNQIKIDQAMPLYLELQAFIGYLNGGPAPYSSLEEGVLIVEKIHAIRKQLGLISSTSKIENEFIG